MRDAVLFPVKLIQAGGMGALLGSIIFITCLALGVTIFAYFSTLPTTLRWGGRRVSPRYYLSELLRRIENGKASLSLTFRNKKSSIS
jgi:hypothetical protein